MKSSQSVLGRRRGAHSDLFFSPTYLGQVIVHLEAEPAFCRPPPHLFKTHSHLWRNTGSLIHQIIQSLSTLKRLAKKAGLRWKRVRKSLKSLRDPADFARCQQELQALQKQEDQGKIERSYFAATGFALASVVPYAWQDPNTVIELPAVKAGRINV